MTLMNEVLVEALKLAERSLQERQTTDSPSATSVMSSSTLPSASLAAATSATSSGSSNSPTSSPLLFFVALGFGVVFTNLWIIVGVKYCFRYNARNRALRAGEDGEPINLENMATRPHRRRREKKLMTMDEVNERFPLIKYKNWVAARVSEGLPTTGGITAPPSRAASVREVDETEPTSPVGTKHSINTRPATATSQTEEITSLPTNSAQTGIADRKSLDATVVEKSDPSVTVEERKEEHHHLEQVQTSVSTLDNKHATVANEEDDEEDDHIHDAVLPEMLNNPGDTCAICIDTLEEDDDVRGLTCGHAFHAGCLDPWLTSRRACCPLCKADYHTPKPRPEGEPEPERTSRRSHGTRANMPQQPQSTWTGLRGNPRLVLPGRFGTTRYEPPVRDERRSRRTRQEPAQPAVAAAPAENTTATSTRWRPNISNPFSSIRLPGRNRAADSTPQQPAGAEPSPSQLEAGVR
ncbi:hypothetical protein CJF30_00005544 [Rutstroemia sp. NJR-2017a BBW]|nr:hypothetical protein CJF30_00005840 [Rutstroemia sp. NJR-2017a BBW]PQE08673.1 hypothetical protein CJF30_00005544 [Rutstroemia sp. NJR-2017a BBW]